MNRPNDLFRNLFLTPLCFLAAFGILMLMGYSYDFINNLDKLLELLIGLALVVGMLIFLIAGIRFLVICAVTIFHLIRYPLWQSENEKWALWAVSRIRSDSKLAEIAREAPLLTALSAVERLQDTDLLEKIATNYHYRQSVRENACEKIEHDWNHCTCKRCGKLRDEQYDWAGCKCRQCGKLRDEQHNWSFCQCQHCGKTREKQHDWDGCKCNRCGETRDEQHVWREVQVEVEYTVASSYESGMEYGPYHTESYLSDEIECLKCGKRK